MRLWVHRALAIIEFEVGGCLSAFISYYYVPPPAGHLVAAYQVLGVVHESVAVHKTTGADFVRCRPEQFFGTVNRAARKDHVNTQEII